MGDATKSLAAEIEARAVKAQAGLARAYELIADQYGTWSPESGTQFSDRGAAEAVEGIRLARELLAEIAALQSRAFEDGARWMRERAAETAYAMPSQILFFWARPGGPPGNGYRPLDGSHVAQAIRALPLQPGGKRNA